MARRCAEEAASEKNWCQTPISAWNDNSVRYPFRGNWCLTPIFLDGSEGDDLHLVQHRPVLPREDDALRGRVVRDAVQHILGAALRGGIKARRVDPPDDLAVVGIDARDPILVPDVRPDF